MKISNVKIGEAKPEGTLIYLFRIGPNQNRLERWHQTFQLTIARAGSPDTNWMQQGREMKRYIDWYFGFTLPFWYDSYEGILKVIVRPALITLAALILLSGITYWVFRTHDVIPDEYEHLVCENICST